MTERVILTHVALGGDMVIARETLGIIDADEALGFVQRYKDRYLPKHRHEPKFPLYRREESDARLIVAYVSGEYAQTFYVCAAKKASHEYRECVGLLDG